MPEDHAHPAQTLGALYFYWTLDSLMELAYAVSTDLLNRPQLYQTAPADKLMELRMRYGNAPYFPDAQQRQMMVTPVLGRSDAQRPDATATSSPFFTSRKKLVDAATAYAERAVDTGIQMLKDRIFSAVVPLRTNLRAAYGNSVESTKKQIAELFHLSVSILRTPDVAKVFGVQPPNDKWPEDSDDPNGAKLVGTAGTTLAGLKTIGADSVMTQDKFVLLRRAAAEGKSAIKEIYAFDKGSDFDALVTTTYTWGTSVRDYQS